MAKLVTNPITSGYASNTALNTNFALIEVAVEKTLSRDGTAPNAMGASLDMNSNKIINLPAPTSANEAARLIDVQAAISGNPNASLVAFTPTGNIAATTVQGALVELDVEKALLAGLSTQTFQVAPATSGTMAIQANQLPPVQNLLPNCNWQMNTTTTYGTAMNSLGTGTVPLISASSFQALNNYPQFTTSNTGELFDGQLVVVQSGTSGFAGTALRVTNVTSNTSFVAPMQLGVLSPTPSTAANIQPIMSGDIVGNTTGAASSGWNKSVSLVNWVDDYATNKCVGAKRVMGMRKTSTGPSSEGFYCATPTRDLTKYLGRTVTFGAFVRQKVQGASGTWRLSISDGVTANTYSTSGTGVSYSNTTYGGYEFISCSQVISTSATQLNLTLVLDGNLGDVYYLALPTLTFGSILFKQQCGQNPLEILDVGHWNPPRLTPLVGTFPIIAFPGTGGLLFGYSGIYCDIGAMSYGTMHQTVKAIKTKIELQTSVQGANFFTGSSLDSPEPLLFGPQQYTNGFEGIMTLNTGVATQADGLTGYIGMGSLEAGANTFPIRVPYSGNIVGMYTQAKSAGAGTRTYTLYKNNTATALTCASTGAGSQAIGLGSVSVIAGDYISIQLITSGGATTSAHNVTLVMGRSDSITGGAAWWPLGSGGNATIFVGSSALPLIQVTFDMDSVRL